VIPILRAEWTKARTVSGPAWLLAGSVLLTVAVSLAVVAATSCPEHLACPVDTVKLSLTGVLLGQAVVAILAVLLIGSEYSTGLIKVTLTAAPQRIAVLAAKALIVTVVVLAGAAVATAGCVVAGRLILPGHGFTESRGFPALSPVSGLALRPELGSVLYLALIALLSLGIATIVRDSAVAIGTALGILYLFPLILSFVTNPTWEHRLERWTPTNAGLAIQETTGLKHLAISPWAGLGVLALWSAASLIAGALTLRLRDA
jgi:ABC-2 type transport system permease protein